MAGPAYRLVTERLELCAAEPSRALEFLRCAEVSQTELIPWMGWATELPDEDEIVEMMRAWRAQFDRDEDRHYHIVERATGEVIGCSGVHPRVRGNAREIGYWIRSDRHGNGLCPEAVGAIVWSEFRLNGLDRLDLYIEAENTASCRVAEKLGFRRIAEVPQQIGFPDGYRDAVVYMLFARDWAPSVEVAAYDVIGRVLSP